MMNNGAGSQLGEAKDGERWKYLTEGYIHLSDKTYMNFFYQYHQHPNVFHGITILIKICIKN